MKRLITVPLMLGALSLSGSAFACQLGNWSASAGGAAAGGPGETPDLARYSGLCAMETTAAGDYVQDNSPAGASETRMISRFYFLVDGGSGTIMEAFSAEDGTGSIFTVSYSGGNVTVTPATGTAAVAAANASGWNSVEVDWNSGGAVDLWVNSDAATDPADASGTDGGSAGVDSVRLGGAGFLFDAYEARRSTSVGRLVAGDANGSGGISIADAVAVLNELNDIYQTGQPDCNESGGMSIADAVCVLNLL